MSQKSWNHRVIPLVDKMKRVGPLTLEQLTPHVGRVERRSNTISKWLKGGWLVVLGDGRYGLGPRAVSAPKPRVDTVPADETGVEGSDQWLLMQQFMHQTLTSRKAAVLLDVDQPRAMAVILELYALGLVRSRGRDRWELTSFASSAMARMV